MKIHQLNAENFKRLRAVEITPDGNVVELRGANAQGKSSILDAIAAALGGADQVPTMPIRRGQERAEIRIDLGEYIVTRRFADRDGKVTTGVIVEAPSGARVQTPQTLLDKIIGKISFDPLAFTRMSAADQRNALRQVVKIEGDIDAWEGLNQRDFEKRRDVRRDAERLKAQIDGMQVRDDAPDKIEDQAAAVTALQDGHKHNAAISGERALRERWVDAVADLKRQASLTSVRAGELRKRAEEADRDTERLLNEAGAGQAKLDAAAPLGEPIDVDALAAEVEAIHRRNGFAAQRMRRDSLAADHAKLVAEATALTKALADRNEGKAKAIAAAEFPVEGLSIEGGEVTFGGFPFDQASQAEKIRVSTAIAMAANPELRVLCIRDGSLLDHASLKLLAEIVTSNDYQLWIEVTDDSGTVGIVIEDGEIKAAPAAEQAGTEA